MGEEHRGLLDNEVGRRTPHFRGWSSYRILKVERVEGSRGNRRMTLTCHMRMMQRARREESGKSTRPEWDGCVSMLRVFDHLRWVAENMLFLDESWRSFFSTFMGWAALFAGINGMGGWLGLLSF